MRRFLARGSPRWGRRAAGRGRRRRGRRRMSGTGARARTRRYRAKKTTMTMRVTTMRSMMRRTVMMMIRRGIRIRTMSIARRVSRRTRTKTRTKTPRMTARRARDGIDPGDGETFGKMVATARCVCRRRRRRWQRLSRAANAAIAVGFLVKSPRAAASGAAPAVVRSAAPRRRRRDRDGNSGRQKSIYLNASRISPSRPRTTWASRHRRMKNPATNPRAKTRPRCRHPRRRRWPPTARLGMRIISHLLTSVTPRHSRRPVGRLAKNATRSGSPANPSSCKSRGSAAGTRVRASPPVPPFPGATSCYAQTVRASTSLANSWAPRAST
mmetsp:Transcript_6691/g.24361  ORF Transcript_6691/g.24361 Transcript_6691/m.24361 type:complete len:326 (+) Transcript_6691:230-1207(+)